MPERVVISVGGSLVVPNTIDETFLSTFRDLVLEKIAGGFSFYVIAGGGKTCRIYQDSARTVNANVTDEDLDWIGIASTRLNASLIRASFSNLEIPEIIQDTTVPVSGDFPLLLSGGMKTGYSSDRVAVFAAQTVGAKKLINLSNIDYVYESDPRTNPDAKKIEKISWADFRKLIPSEWNPGLSSPFDPVAAREAEASGIEVAVINGAKLEELSNYLDGKPFIGTVIS